jgi:hypothetical protein
VPQAGAFTSRETIFAALFALLKTVTPPDYVGGAWNLTSRDLQQWDVVGPVNQPALFMTQTPQDASMPEFALTQWQLSALVVVYYRTDGIPNSDVARDTIVNNFVDAFDSAINPQPGEPQTLGGLVLHTYISGKVFFDSGLTDQQAVIGIPITMLIGAFGA